MVQNTKQNINWKIMQLYLKNTLKFVINLFTNWNNILINLVKYIY